ncbi:type IV pilus biogenesis/stability protein PilW [Thiomonas sp. FB-6]|uniref:type IV pilus biogenesis/stability protein PilW n=1 Tax=Thiomonas sp. FB-6 TaxID=1158291 RepID=UPI00036F1178|nr:type IV pilus biogenesis/stability protein PilW [Thiomonas sp. FB-6]
MTATLTRFRAARLRGARAATAWTLGLALAVLGGCAAPGGGASGSGNYAGTAPGTQPTQADKSARIRLELAEGYYQRGQPDVALGEVTQALQEDPGYVPAYTMQALIHMSLGQNDQAESSFRKALSLAPSNPDTLHNYGWFLCSVKRYPESFEMFRKALAVPGYRNAQRTDLAYGVCQYRAGDLPGAEKTLRQGFALDPSNPALSTNLAMVQYLRHEYPKAMFYIRRVNSGNAATAQTLWLGVLIARKAGDAVSSNQWSQQLVQKYPDSAEAIAAQQGHYDDSALLPH